MFREILNVGLIKQNVFILNLHVFLLVKETFAFCPFYVKTPSDYVCWGYYLLDICWANSDHNNASK